MDAETLRKAPEPFFTTKGLGKGTGLGLSMVQGLAVQLNGALILASEPGRGTVAQLWLPVTGAIKQAEPHKAVSPGQAGEPPE
jgi:signal transduction histidine kinase